MQPQETPTERDSPPREPMRDRVGRAARYVAVGVSAACLAAVTVLYLGRWDAVAAATLFPAWVWAAGGIMLALVGARRRPRRVALAVAFAWLCFAAIFSDETRALSRWRPWGDDRLQRSRGDRSAIRVVTLNCAGSARAAQEVVAFEPDIVMMQESPSQEAIERLARSLFGESGDWRRAGDTAIVSRWPIEDSSEPIADYFTLARVRAEGGVAIDLVSLHLVTPNVLLNLARPSVWREQAATRATQRRQLAKIAASLASRQAPAATIVAGDFNAPPNARIYEEFGHQLSDAHHTSGIGWGNTIINQLPVIRIDQVWLSHGIRPSAVIARTTKFSDHRMVICDAWLEEPR